MDLGPGSHDVTLQAVDVNGRATEETWCWDNGPASPRTFTYDTAGRLTNDGLRAYTWDMLGRLKSTTVTASNTTTSWFYDGLNRCAREESGGQVRRFVWDGMRVFEQINADGSKQRRWSNGVELLAADGTQSGRRVELKDHLGSVRTVVNESGAVTHSYDYDAWGTRVRLDGNATPDWEFGFTGHRHHGSGLILAPFRVYDPETGRWISPDPIEEAGGLNLYGYCAGDPVNLVDPDGLDFGDWWMRNIVDSGIQDFVAGVGDSASFGLTALAREANGLGDVVDKCSSAYAWGERVQVGADLATLGVSGGLKVALKLKGKAVARKEANAAIRGMAPTQHHVNTVIGHNTAPGKMRSSHFPLGGLSPKIHSGKWNLKKVPTNPRRGILSDKHYQMHQAAAKAEDIALGNAALAPLRIARNAMTDNCE